MDGWMDGWMDRLICRFNSFDLFWYEFPFAIVLNSFLSMCLFVCFQNNMCYCINSMEMTSYTRRPLEECHVYCSTEPYRCGGDNHRVSVYSKLPSPRVNSSSPNHGLQNRISGLSIALALPKNGILLLPLSTALMGHTKNISQHNDAFLLEVHGFVWDLSQQSMALSQQSMALKADLWKQCWGWSERVNLSQCVCMYSEVSKMLTCVSLKVDFLRCTGEGGLLWSTLDLN